MPGGRAVNTIVRIEIHDKHPRDVKRAYQVEDSRSDLDAEDMMQLLYQAMLAAGYAKETVDEIAKDNP